MYETSYIVLHIVHLWELIKDAHYFFVFTGNRKGIAAVSTRFDQTQSEDLRTAWRTQLSRRLENHEGIR